MNIKPIFKHDCTSCTYLGISENGKYDFYYCKQISLPTVIARFGNEGNEYKSGMDFVGIDADLKQAYKIAKSRGLIH